MLHILISALMYITCIQASSQFYDSYSGNVLTDEEVVLNVIRNTTFWCVNEIEPCNLYEGRRLDGSCNNLKYPYRGAPHTPLYRLLPPHYDKGFEPRRSKSGDPLPLSRSVRTNVLAEGRIPSSKFTQLFTHFFVHLLSDFTSVHDTVNYVLWVQHCCQKEGKKDRQCTPNIIPEKDPVHMFSSIRCMNLTRPISFQSIGCVRHDTVPERLISETPVLDLSHIYGNSLNALNEKGRLFKMGLLKYEEENGKIWPPSMKTKETTCVMNHPPHETRCHDTPGQGMNGIFGHNLFSIWSWRLHNHIAATLHKLNPCWSDDRLFYTTRDILTAIIIQILYHEFMSTLLGYENLVKEGIISTNPGFRDLYDDNFVPQISIDFIYAMRWAHIIQEGRIKMYDENGYYLKEDRVVNMTLRTGYLPDNIQFITQGAFRQRGAKYGYIVDPDLAEISLGAMQVASDVFANDLSKGRYFGIAPYIEYRKLCSGKTYKNFKDLLDVIDNDRILLLMEKYKYIEDVDFMTGIWLERAAKGSNVPPTLYCIIVEQLHRFMISDRHWYERPNRPNAFTKEQLLEIRKATVAQILCAVGDSVTEIQPRAFYLHGKGNERMSCKEIQKMTLLPWKDNNCKKEEKLPSREC